MLINMSAKIILKVGPDEFVAERVYGLVKHSNSFEEAKRLVFKINLNLFNKIKNCNSFVESKDELITFTNRETNKTLVVEKTEILQNLINEKTEKFFNKIKEVIGCESYYDNFIGYTTDLIVGNYCEDNKFIIRIVDNLDASLYTIMEEVLHIIYWNYWREIFNQNIEKPWKIREEPKEGLSVWKISEMIPEYFFAFKGSSGREKSYPWIPALRRMLDPIWDNKKDFKDFMIKTHKLCGFKEDERLQ